METRGENGFEPLGLKYFPRRGVLLLKICHSDKCFIGGMINRWYDQPVNWINW